MKRLCQITLLILYGTCSFAEVDPFSEMARTNLPQLLKIMAAEYHNKVPIETSDLTIIDAIAIDRHLTLIAVLKTSHQKTPNRMALVSYICSSTTLSTIIKSGGTWSYQYLNESGMKISELSVYPGDC